MPKIKNIANWTKDNWIEFRKTIFKYACSFAAICFITFVMCVLYLLDIVYGYDLVAMFN